MLWPQITVLSPRLGGYDLRLFPVPEPIIAVTPLQTPEQAEKQKKVDVEVQGYRYIRFREYSSSGSQARFESTQGLFSRGATIEQGTDLSLVATMGDSLTLSGNFYEMPRQDREMDFELKTGLYSLKFGDLVVSFKGGTFSPFSKKITGVEMGYATDKTYMQLISSKAKSQTHTETFTGRNIKGPYDLGANDLVPDKFEVRLNNETLPRSDYILDAFLGEITFYKIIGPNDTVTVTYEQRLRGSLDAGNLMGLAGGYKTDRWTVGVSHLTQEANTEAQSVQTAVSDETAVFSLADSSLTVANEFIVRTRYTGSETIQKVTSSTTETLEPGVDYNTGLSIGEKMVNYRNGRFILADPDPSATYLVSYAYYPQNGNIMQQQIKEAILPVAGLYTFSKQTIYYGSEEIRVCVDASLDSCTITLIRGTDYEIDENLNRLTLHNYQSEPYLRIDYWYYPIVDIESTAFDHSVDDIIMDYQFSDAVSLKAEFAMSQSDVSNKPIQALNENLGTVTGELNCETGFVSAACTFELDHRNVVQNSVVVYYNDRLVSSNILSQYSHYVVDTVQGTVEIKITIPAGTTILADYQYLSEREPGVETGEIWQVGGNYAGEKTKLALALKGADTFFTPVGGENNMEVSRFNWNLSHTFSPAMSFSARGLSVDNALDLEQSHTNSSEQAQYDFNWKGAGGVNLSLGYTTRANTDDFDPHQTDTSQTGYNIAGGAPMPFLKNASFNFGHAKDKLTNNIEGGSSNQTKQNNFGLTWAPMQQLSMTGSMNTSTLDTESPSENYSSQNRSRSLAMTYMPVPLITFGAKIDRQATSDSRPDTEPTIINQTMIRFDTRPFWKVNFLGIVHTKNDRPSINSPSSHSETTTYNSSLAITRALAFSPSYNTTTSVFGSDSENKNENTIYKIEYRPPGRPYYINVGTEKGKRSSISSTVNTQSDITRNNIEFGYNPSTIWSFSARFEAEDNKSSLGEGSNSTVDTLNMRLKYAPSGEKSHWLTYSQNALGGLQNYTQSTLEFGLDYRLTEMFSWDLIYRLSDNNDSKYPDNSYSGQLIESSLRIEF